MKMLKKIFGVVTVSVALGAVSLKADFEKDLAGIRSWFDLETSESAGGLVEKYSDLYSKFKKDVLEEFLELSKLRCAENADPSHMDDLHLPTKGEVEILKFAFSLWSCIWQYADPGEKLVIGYCEKEKNDTCRAFSAGCYSVFMRRMCEFGLTCIRNAAGRFESEALFNEEELKPNCNTVREIMKPFLKSVGICVVDHLFEDFTKKIKECEHITMQPKDAKAFCISMFKGYEKTAGCLAGYCESLLAVVSKSYSSLSTMPKGNLEMLKGKNIDAFLEGYAQLDAEREEAILEELKPMLAKKDAVCECLKQGSQELRDLEGKIDFPVYCAKPNELRQNLAKMVQNFKGNNQSYKKKEYEQVTGELKKEHDEHDLFWKKIEALRKEVFELEKEVLRQKDAVEAEYKRLLSEKSFEEEDLAQYVLEIRKCDAYFKSFFYGHTIIKNVLHGSVLKKLKDHMNKVINKKHLKELELTDDFGDEYDNFVKSI